MKKKAMTILLTVMLFVGLTAVPAGASAKTPDAPDPFYAADFAGVLTEDTENYIIEKNGILENECGGQIVVVTVDFLDGMDIEDYAYKLFNSWKIGDEDENNGVLLLLVIGEENYWCMQGKGLESALSSGDIDDILWNDLEDDFAEGNYNAGVEKTFDALYDEVAAYYGVSDADGDFSDEEYGSETSSLMQILVGILLVLAVLVFIILVVVLLRAAGRNRTSRRMYDDRPVYIPPARRRRPQMPPREPHDRPPGDRPGAGHPDRRHENSIPSRRPGTGRRTPESKGAAVGSSRPSRPIARPSSRSSARPSTPKSSAGSTARRKSSVSRSGSGHGGGGTSRGGGSGRRGR